MYKRKPRIVFLAEHPEISIMAQLVAEQLGSQWLDSTATSFNTEHIAWWQKTLQFYGKQLKFEVYSEKLLDWADLLISLDQKTTLDPPSLPLTTRVKHWPIQDNATLADQLGQRISGMLGGIRMLHKV